MLQLGKKTDGLRGYEACCGVEFSLDIPGTYVNVSETLVPVKRETFDGRIIQLRQGGFRPYGRHGYLPYDGSGLGCPEGYAQMRISLEKSSPSENFHYKQPSTSGEITFVSCVASCDPGYRNDDSFDAIACVNEGGQCCTANQKYPFP